MATDAKLARFRKDMKALEPGKREIESARSQNRPPDKATPDAASVGPIWLPPSAASKRRNSKSAVPFTGAFWKRSWPW